MLEKMMITVSNESWTQEFWLKEFNAEHQANIIKLLEKKWEFSFDNIFPIYAEKVDFQKPDHIKLLAINVVLEYFKDKLSPILHDICLFKLHNGSYDCAYGIYIKGSKFKYSLMSSDIPLSFFIGKWHEKKGKEFLKIGDIDYNWSDMNEREIVKLVVKKALHG